MAGVFKIIQAEDQTITPFKVYKSWEYSGTASTRFSNITSQSVLICTAIKPDSSKFTNKLIPLDFDEECNLDFSSRLLNFTAKYVPAGVLWHSLKHSYFNDYNGNILVTAGATPNISNPSNINSWSGNTFKNTTPSLLKFYDNIQNTLNPSSSHPLPTLSSVISIPQSKFGEEIKPGSVQLIVTSSLGTTLSEYRYILQDDGYGNLMDTSVSSSVKLNNRIFYLGFNESEYETDLSKTNLCDTRYPTELNFYNVSPVKSFITTQIGTFYDGSSDVDNLASYGLAGYFSQSYVRIDGTPSYFNPRTQDNYAVSFWFKLDSLTPPHGLNSYLITKRGISRNYGLVTPSGRRVAGNSWNTVTNVFPYDIRVTAAGQLQARVGDGTTIKTLTYTVTAATYYHCVFQKSGSAYELWIDGTLADSETNVSLSNITNKSDIFIGSLGTNKNDLNVPYSYMHGKIDEVQIFNTYLTPSEIQVLSYNNTLNNNLLNRHGVGKIFYKEGLIVINNPNPKYGAKFSARNTFYSSYFPDVLFSSALYNNGDDFKINSTTGLGDIISLSSQNLNTSGSVSNLTIKWNSTLTLYENEFLCRINEDEFNFTTNPSIRKDQENGQLPQEFIYNEEFGPYITTIGLYNDNAELLAIGKLGSPIKKRSNVDLNIIVRFDQ